MEPLRIILHQRVSLVQECQIRALKILGEDFHRQRFIIDHHRNAFDIGFDDAIDRGAVFLKIGPAYAEHAHGIRNIEIGSIGELVGRVFGSDRVDHAGDHFAVKGRENAGYVATHFLKLISFFLPRSQFTAIEFASRRTLAGRKKTKKVPTEKTR